MAFLEKLKVVPKAKSDNGKKIAIYHVVYENENFEDAVKAFIELTSTSQKKYGNKKMFIFRYRWS